MAAKALENNNLVKNRRGDFGVVVSWNGKPKYIVYKALMQIVDKFDDNLNYKGVKSENRNYDIVEIYDGSSITNADEVFKPKFTAEGLPLLWKEE
jgi:hypothetical protein